MTLEQCRWLVLRLSGVLWTELGGHFNKWDGLALRLLRGTPKGKKRAFDLFYREQLFSVGMAEKVWDYISQMRKGIDADPGTSEGAIQSLLERLAQDGNRGGEAVDGGGDGSDSADDLSRTGSGLE